jgi:two-component system cell cycle response regulator CpdR
MPSRLRILYVEDRVDVRDAIGEYLGFLGHDVTSCEHAEAALDVLRDRSFDLLITDVSLPGMSGTDLARTVLRDKPDHWVLLCSGYDFGPALATLGPNVRSLTKSFKPEDMQRLVDDVAASLAASRG